MNEGLAGDGREEGRWKGNREGKRMRETKGRAGKAAVKGYYYTSTYIKEQHMQGCFFGQMWVKREKIAVLKSSEILSKRLHKRAMSFLN